MGLIDQFWLKYLKPRNFMGNGKINVNCAGNVFLSYDTIQIGGDGIQIGGTGDIVQVKTSAGRKRAYQNREKSGISEEAMSAIATKKVQVTLQSLLVASDNVSFLYFKP